MSRKRYKPEQVVNLFRKIQVEIANGKKAAQAGREAGICEQTYYRWQSSYPAMVKRLERDLPELLSFFSFPRPPCRKLRTTNVIKHCYVEVQLRIRPIVCFVNNGMNEKHQWKNRTLHLFTQAV